MPIEAQVVTSSFLLSIVGLHLPECGVVARLDEVKCLVSLRLSGLVAALIVVAHMPRTHRFLSVPSPIRFLL